jgi:hypothetical protein
MEEVKHLVTFYLNDKPIRNKKILLSSTLTEVRNLIQLKENVLFINNGVPIDLEDEDETNINEIIDGEQVKLLETEEAIENQIDNKPIEGAKHIESLKKIPIYLYPSW